MTGKLLENSVLLHTERRHLLCVRSRGSETFYFPGGKRGEREIAVTTLVRKIREELGVYIQPETIRQVGVFDGPADGDVWHTVRLTCFTARFHGKIYPSSEIEEVGWLDYSQMKRMAMVGRPVMRWLRKEGLI